MLQDRSVRHTLAAAFALLLAAGTASAQQLFVGLESPDVPTRTTTLAGFPNVTWTNRFVFEVSGAAARPDGTLLLCNGPFTTHLYSSTLQGPPQLLCTTAVDLQGLGYGGGALYGFSNFASPMGIYEVNPSTGACTLRVSTADTGFRFFGLDFNDADGLLYGFTEYGNTGLYSINVATGVMTRIVGTPPGVGGQGRALAVGQNTVYLLATRGDEQEPVFAYNLAQGPNGTWTAFTQPYPTQHASGGATWIPGGPSGIGQNAPAAPRLLELAPVFPNPASGAATIAWTLGAPALVRLEVFDVSGRAVARLVDEPLGTGFHQVVWNGRGGQERRLPAGCYLARLSAGSETRAATVTLR